MDLIPPEYKKLAKDGYELAKQQLEELKKIREILERQHG
jgi:hypothetical protein